MKNEIVEVICPIRLMFGIGNNMIQGFSIVYEKPDKSAGSRSIWFDSEIFKRVRFSDEESCIIFNKEFIQGGLFKETEVQYHC